MGSCDILFPGPTYVSFFPGPTVYRNLFDVFLGTMSVYSRATKVQPKGTVREFKIVQSVTRQGGDTLKMEEIRTPRRDSKRGSSSTTRNESSSPAKRLKLDGFDAIPLPCDLEGPDDSHKRQTLVIISLSAFPTFSDILKGQNDFLEQFLGHETSYLWHLLDLELPPTNRTCTTCGEVGAEFRCLDCYGPHWWCKACLIKNHSHHPFHRPQQWKDGSFENVSLCDLGYIFALGHTSTGLRCPDDDNMYGDRLMTLIHVNGVFKHCVSFCHCPGALPEHEQLFAHRLFASSFDRPQTAFTLDVLDYYAIDAMECKTSAQSFFHKLRRVTNNAFPDELPVSSCFPSFELLTSN